MLRHDDDALPQPIRAATPVNKSMSRRRAGRCVAPPDAVDDTALGGTFKAATGAGGAAGASELSVAGGAAAETGSDAPTEGRSFPSGPCSRSSRLRRSRERRFTYGNTAGATSTSEAPTASSRSPASRRRLRLPRLAHLTPGQQLQTCLDGCSTTTLSSDDDSRDDAHSHRSRLLGRLTTDLERHYSWARPSFSELTQQAHDFQCVAHSAGGGDCVQRRRGVAPPE